MPRASVKDDFIINYLKDITDLHHVYPDIPFKRGVNVTTEQHDIITKYLNNLDKPAHLRKYNYCIKAPRRCGKTTLFTRLIPLIEKKIKLLDYDVVTGEKTERAKMRILIAAMTFKKIKSLYWEPLLHFSQKVGLGYRPFGGEGEDIITPKGTLIHFRSLRDKNTIDLLRGEKFILSLIDEAQSVTDKVFLELPSALKAALTDYGGMNIITGTEAKVPFGFWYDVSQGGRGYEVDNLTIENNIFYSMKTREAMIEDERLIWGWEKGNEPAWVRREFRGEAVWDQGSRIFNYKPSVNHYGTVDIPENERMYVIGVDLGFKDADAFSVLCYSYHSEEVYLVEEIVRERQDTTTCCNKIRELSETYGMPPVIVDSGGIGRKVMEEMITRYSVNAEAAEKSEKGGWIHAMRNSLHRGELKIRQDSEAVEEMNKTEWNEKEDNWSKEGYHPNLLDAIVYAFRHIYNMTLANREVKEKEPTSHAARIEQQMESAYRNDEEDESSWFDQ